MTRSTNAVEDDGKSRPKREATPAQLAALERARAARAAKSTTPQPDEIRPGVPRVSPLRAEAEVQSPRDLNLERARRRQLLELSQKDLTSIVMRFDGRARREISALPREALIDMIIVAERRRRS